MDVWGPGWFDNDAAMTWMSEVVEGDVAVMIAEALEAVLMLGAPASSEEAPSETARPLGVAAAARGVAAAALVARFVGGARWVSRRALWFDPAVRIWCAATPTDCGKEARELAGRALLHVRSSALAESWSQLPDGDDEWRASITALEQDLAAEPEAATEGGGDETSPSREQIAQWLEATGEGTLTRHEAAAYAIRWLDEPGAVTDRLDRRGLGALSIADLMRGGSYCIGLAAYPLFLAEFRADWHPCVGAISGVDCHGLMDLYFYEDALVATKGSKFDVMVRSLSLAPNTFTLGLGGAVADSILRRHGAVPRRAHQSREELLAMDRKNFMVRFDDIAQVRLKKGFFGNPNLTLTLHDGSAHTFHWRATKVSPEYTDGLLRDLFPNLLEG